MSERREPITPDGFERLKNELHKLKNVDRVANIKAIDEARSHGDLSENAEYHAAKEEQGMIAARIAKNEHFLAMAEVIDPSMHEGDDIVFGATVSLVDTETEEEMKYRIVGAYEADVKSGSISIDSPIAKSLIGKSVGDEVIVKTPKGNRQLAILTVEYK